MINVSLSTIKKLAVILTFLLTSCSSQSPLPALSENRTVQSLPINIKQGMPYLEARGILIKDGWQIITMHTTPNGTPSCWMSDWDETKSPKISCDYAEVDSCSGTGMGFCKMWFFDGEDKCLKIITSGGEPGPVIDSGNFASVSIWEKMNLSNFEKENGR